MTLDLNPIRERLEKASPGPWEHVILSKYNRIMSTDGLYILERNYGTSNLRDGEFIAHSRQDMEDLLNEVERLQEENKRLHDDGEHNFSHGVLAALALVASHDQETIYHEIVNTVDEDQLIKTAQQEQCTDWAGLTKYGYTKLKKLREEMGG